MTHDNYKELLSALLDGELSESERGAALAHLAECEACRTYFAELNAMRGALNDMDEAEPPADFAAGVLARLHEDAAPQPIKKHNPWRRWGALAACAAVIVLAVSTLPRMGTGMKASAPSSAEYSAAAPAEAPSEETDYGFAAVNDALADADGEQEMPEAWLESSAVTAPRAEEPEEAAPARLESSKSAVSGVELPAESAEPTAPLTTDAAASTEPTAPLTATAAEYPPYTLTLVGEGAAEWLEANAEPLGGGLWRVSVEAVNELPDTLALVAADGPQEPVDGTLIITYGTPENPQ